MVVPNYSVMPHVGLFVVSRHSIQVLVKKFATFTTKLPYLRVVVRGIKLQASICRISGVFGHQRDVDLMIWIVGHFLE